MTALWPDKPDSDWEYTQALALLLATIGAVLAAAAIAGLRWTVPNRIQRTAPWLLALAILVGAWEIVTAKRGLLPMPFFPPPQAILEVMIDDWKRLLEGVVASLRLLAGGYLIGAAVGFIVGVAIGWSRPIGYWIHPILRVVGPLPATAWLPLAFFIFLSSLSASTFLIALATGFPVAVLTWSGVAGVSSAYYDVARTLGASRWFLVVQVAIPALCLTSSSAFSWGSAIRSRCRRCGNARSQGGSRLVFAMGPGLGRLREHVRRTSHHGVGLFGADHAPVPSA